MSHSVQSLSPSHVFFSQTQQSCIVLCIPVAHDLLKNYTELHISYIPFARADIFMPFPCQSMTTQFKNSAKKYIRMIVRTLKMLAHSKKYDTAIQNQDLYITDALARLIMHEIFCQYEHILR